jgi:arginase
LELNSNVLGLAVVETFKQRRVEGYWLHLDVDVLDPLFMPAVDTPTSGGLDLSRSDDAVASPPQIRWSRRVGGHHF